MTKRTAILWTISTLALLCVLIWSGSRIKKSNQSDAIKNVLKERTRCIIASIPNGKPLVKNGIVVNMNRNKFSNAISKIDTTKCPKDFRQAWLDYIFAQNAESQGASIGESLEFFGDLGSVQISNAGKVAAKQDERFQNKMNAWKKCISIAIQYGAE
ncbi:MAG TPA: hypothetical protein VHC44_18770 [Verrucomicrobiae bacterium]|nr:hypothetical protein [Verrucomicrobiae bacterium]